MTKQSVPPKKDLNGIEQNALNIPLPDHNAESTPDLVDLNTVLKEVFIEQQQRMKELKVISRCDALPTVAGNIQELKKLFGCLINIVLNHPPETSKQFIYIKCDVTGVEVLDMTLPPEYHNYLISFHTNINTSINWLEKHEKDWLACQKIAQSHSVQVISDALVNTGCLFSITLPGKMS